MNKDTRYQIIREKDKKKLQELSLKEKENIAANLAQVNNSKKREMNRGKKVLLREKNGKTVSNIFDPKTNTWSENKTRKKLNKEYEELIKKVDAELYRGVNKGGKRTRRKRKRRRKSTKKKRKRKKTKKKRSKRRKRTKKSRY